jgi:PadR family transcriptional regulator, regulatory protein PadR
MSDSLELLKGTLDLLVLRTVALEPMHGYGISEWIRARTDGALAVQDAALYQALRRLEARGLVDAEWGVSENNRRARYYRLTAAGRKKLAAETAAWFRYTDAVHQVLEPQAKEA